MSTLSAIKIIHVDDEQSSLDNFKSIVTTFANVEYCGGFSNPLAALAYIQNNPVQIVFTDVEMGDEGGFWLAEQLKEFNISLVFVSNHSQYAIQAFEACSIHYLLKPVLKDDIAECINRYLKYHLHENIDQPEKITELLSNYFDSKKYPKRIFVFNLEKTHIIDVEKLMYAKAMATYTKFVLQDGKEIISSKNLKVYDDALEKHPEMVRAHRSILVNKKFIVCINRNKHLASIVLENGEEVEISLYKKEDILKQLEV